MWGGYLKMGADWANEWGLEVECLLSKGYSAEVFQAIHVESGRVMAVKVERDKSRRNHAMEKEALHLAAANQLEIGPTLYGFDPDRRIVIMELISGTSFEKFVLDENPSKLELLRVIRLLLQQAKKLDQAGIAHGQLGGRGTNILVKKEKNHFVPVLIDFEKASQTRKCHNVSQLHALLLRNPRARLAQAIREKIGRKILVQTLK